MLSFVVLPFVILSFGDSITVWSHVYFYGIVCTFASLAFFASPAKALLIKQIKLRNKRAPLTSAQETARPPTLGLPNDPEREFEEAVQEIREEIEARRRRGSVTTMPTGAQLKAAVESKIGRKL